MSTILSVATHATDDPTKATLAFATAVGALGARKRAQLALLGEGAYLALPGGSKTVHGVGFPQLDELMAKLVGAEVEIFVWGVCAVARGVTEEDVAALNSKLISAVEWANLVSDADKVVVF